MKPLSVDSCHLFTAMLMLTAPIKRLTGVSEFLQRGLAASESVFELLDTPGEINSGIVTIGRATEG